MRSLSKRTFLLTAAAMIGSLAVQAGSIVLTLGQPEAHPDARAKVSAFVLRVDGCKPSDAQVKFTAEGLVDGKRQSIPLTSIPLEDHAYAVPRQWPKDGVWLVKAEITTSWAARQGLVVLDGKGVDRAATKLNDQFSEAQVTARLNELASKTLAKR